MQIKRLNNPSSIPVEFVWNGNRTYGREGDSLAAALHAAGVRYLAPSRKFHQPRGLSGSFVAGHLATVNGIPNCRLENVILQNGMDVRMQGTWPLAKLDIFRLNRLIPKRWLRGGFEHPWFIPDSSLLWKPWERGLAFAAGGALPPPSSQASIPTGHRITATTVIVGGGPVGQLAAQSANSAVALITRGAVPDNLPDRVQVYGEHQVFALYNSARLVAAAPLDATKPALLIDTEQVILATGRHSIPPLIPGAALPGVLDAGTALSLARKHGVAAGKEVIVIGTLDGQSVSEQLRELGVNVIDYLDVSRVFAIRGRNQVSGVELETGIVSCDAVIHAGPWRADPKLPFQAASDGELRLMAGDLPGHLSIVGGAADSAQPVSFGANDAPVPQALVCPCMDVTVAEVQQLVREGVTHVEEIKHRTGCGMGPCQGVPCWDLLAAVVGHATGESTALIGHPSYRPPAAAITFAQAAGMDEITGVAP